MMFQNPQISEKIFVPAENNLRQIILFNEHSKKSCYTRLLRIVRPPKERRYMHLINATVKTQLTFPGAHR